MKSVHLMSISLIALAAGSAYGADVVKSGSVSLEIDAVIVKPTGMPTDYAYDSGAVSSQVGSNKAVDFSNKFTPRIAVGYLFGEGEAVTATYWGINASESSSASGANMWDSLYNPSFGFYNFNGKASATVDVKAHTLDVAYSRPFLTAENFGVSGLVGIRQASLKYTDTATYISGATKEVAAYESENKGVGLRFGLTGSMHYFDNKLALSAGAAYSLLQGSEDLSDVQTRNGTAESKISKNSDRNFGILEANISAEYTIWRSLVAKIGYEFNMWQGASAREEFTDDVNNFATATRRENVSFNGFVIGVGWTQAF